MVNQWSATFTWMGMSSPQTSLYCCGWAILLQWRRKGNHAGQVQALRQIPQLRWTLTPSWRHSSNPQGSLPLCSPQNSRSNSEKEEQAVDWKTQLSWEWEKCRSADVVCICLPWSFFCFLWSLPYCTIVFSSCVCIFCFHSWSFLPLFFFPRE